MFYLALIILTCYYFIALVNITFPIKLSRKTMIFIWVCYIISLSVIGYYIVPNQDLDLYRMYRDIDNLRTGITTIYNTPFLLNNLIYMIVSKTNYNGWYAVISVVIIGGLELALIKEIYSKNKIVSGKALALYLLGCNANSFFVYLFIGRSFVVAAIYVYAYYIWKERNKIVFWILIFSSCFIHALGIVLLVFTIAYDFAKKKQSRGVNVLMIAIVFATAYVLSTDLPGRFFETINLEYFSLLQDKYHSYSLRGIEFQQGREMLFRALNMLYMLICIFYLWRKNNNKHMIWGFFIMITFACFNFSIIFERMPYVLGIALLPVLNDVLITSKGIMKKSFILFGAIILIMQTIWGIYEASLWLDFGI